MKIYTLMQTDVDTVYTSVTVFTNLQDAINAAVNDIEKNGSKIIDGGAEEGGSVKWSALHTDGTMEFWSVVKEHEVE